MQRAFKLLVVADDTPEFPAALFFAALRASVVGGQVVILRAIDVSTADAHWVTVGEEVRREALADAEALLARYGGEVRAETGLEAETLVREGEVRAEIRKLLDEDNSIRLIVLAAGGGGDPGPLISGLARGQGFGGRSVPIVVVPSGLTRDALREIAVP